MDEAAFEAAYLARLDVARLAERFAAIAQAPPQYEHFKPLALVYFEDDRHRGLFAAWWERQTGERVREWGETTENLPWKPWDLEVGYPPIMPGEKGSEYRTRLRRMEAEHEAAKSPQQRLRERKEREARERSFNDHLNAALAKFDAAINAMFPPDDDADEGEAA
jgi:hypothetical protein